VVKWCLYLFGIIIISSQERFQLSVVVYDFFSAAPQGHILRKLAAVDRFVIDIIMGPSPAHIYRKTYTGIYNISSWDLSFSVKCSRNFYGKDCNNHCVQVPDLYICNERGVKVFLNKLGDDNPTIREEAKLKGTHNIFDYNAFNMSTL